MFITIINGKVHVKELAAWLYLPINFIKKEYNLGKKVEFISLDTAMNLALLEGNTGLYNYLAKESKEDSSIISKIEELIKDVRQELPDCKSRTSALKKLIQVKNHVKDVGEDSCEYSYNTLTWQKCPQCKNRILTELFFNKMNKNYRYICPSCQTNVVVVIEESKDE